MTRAKTQKPVAKKRAPSHESIVPTAPFAKPKALFADLDDESGIRIEEAEIVQEAPHLRALKLAVYEVPASLPSAQGAITAAGHAVIAAGSGRPGLETVRAALPTADALVVALPGGEALIEAALALSPRPVIVASCAGAANDAALRAVAAGADLVCVRPHDVDRLAPILLAASRLADERAIAATARGAETLLRGRLDQLADVEQGTLQPFHLFQYVLELEIKRCRRYGYPLAVALFAVDVPPPPPPAGVRGILKARAGNAIVHAIRDIDLATELDRERFLVLLPYTDVSGGAEVARRVIAAVAAGDPVVAAGRSLAPSVIGAVAGGSTGAPLSFSKLVRDAAQALEHARRDGATLAVQP